MARKSVLIATAAVVSVIALLWVVPLFWPWTPLNCRCEDVDISTGRLRYTRYLLFIKTSERIEESPLSKVLPHAVVTGAKPAWRRVNTFSPGSRHSPHHAFLSGIYQIKQLAGLWEMSDFYGLPEALRQTVALHVLALWRYGDSDSLASDYLSVLLSDLMEENRRSRILNALPTLQMPLRETNASELSLTVFYPTAQPMDRVQGYMDESGDFIRDGIWERWWPNGKRELYGHFKQGEHHGRRFEWNRDGKLMVIEGFNRGRLSEYESDNLDQHEAFNEAQKLVSSEETTPGE